LFTENLLAIDVKQSNRLNGQTFWIAYDQLLCGIVLNNIK
jgi:hypothetical protein